MGIEDIKRNIRERISIVARHTEQNKPKHIKELDEYFTGYATALTTLLEDLENGYIS